MATEVIEENEREARKRRLSSKEVFVIDEVFEVDRSERKAGKI